MAERYDVVVIGGGVAGLATAALLARSGRHVIVLERGNQLGGRAYTYTDKGFTLNYGAHTIYRPHTGLLAQVLKRLGRPAIEAPYPDPKRSYWSLDGRWGALGAKPQDILTTPLFPLRSRLRLLPLLLSFRYSDPAKLGDLTFGEWLARRTSDATVRRFGLALATLNSYTRPAGDLSARFMLRHLQRTLFVKDYVGYMSGGWSMMYEAFASALRERGGEIATGTAASRLLIEGGRAVAILAGDRRFEADAFVLTIPPQEAPGLAEPDSPLRQELERWHGLRDVRALCMDLGFSRRLRTDATFIFDVPYDLYFSLHSEVTPDLAPEGGQLLHAMAYLSPEEADDDWLQERRQDELERGLDRHFAGWRESVVVARRLPRARVTAVRQTPDQQGAARVPAKAQTTANLFFAGDARDLPYNLTDISLASALQVADLVERQLAAPATAAREAATAVAE
ncbi:MAG: FAD-dependent oxidoreductase [Chloroflexi bacterium]|nr:FAD-dependent oxidoreductase [Chloroflexota bacterium]